jgi:subtilisin-like proprotein convertase family protein
MDARNSIIIIFAFLLVAGSALPADAAPVLTYQADFNLPIPANLDDTEGWMDDAVIDIPDHFTILDLDVSLNVTHGAFFDLQIHLTSPAGTNILLNDSGNLVFIERKPDGRLGPIGGNLTLSFDDQAELPIDQASRPFTDPYKPIDPYTLSMFNGEDIFGQWRLRICDAAPAHTGNLHNLKLTFTVPEPASAILLTFGVTLITLLKHRRDS